jgi:hypothetical protein
MSTINEQLGLKGELTITLTDKDGKVKDQRKETNLVVNDGLFFITERMVGNTPAVMSHLAVGSGTVAPAAGNTTLTELGRVALTSATATNNTVNYVATFPAGTGTGAVTEAGVFNSATTGDMLCRTVFSVVNKAADDVMTINWTITLNAA